MAMWAIERSVMCVPLGGVGEMRASGGSGEMHVSLRREDYLTRAVKDGDVCREQRELMGEQIAERRVTMREQRDVTRKRATRDIAVESYERMREAGRAESA